MAAGPENDHHNTGILIGSLKIAKMFVFLFLILPLFYYLIFGKPLIPPDPREIPYKSGSFQFNKHH